MPEFEKLGAVVVAISTDNVDSLVAWCGQLGTSYYVCADFWPHGLVSLKYDVLRSNGVADRAWFVIDRDGIVRLAELYPANQVPPVEPALEALRRL